MDFFLDEVDYSVDDINTHLYIFRRNLNEVKKREREMNEVNMHSKKLRLGLMQKSRKNYLDYIVNYCKKNMENENIAEKVRSIEERIKMELAQQKSLNRKAR